MAAEIPDGAVIVARAILNSSLWSMPLSDSRMAITCICIANWKDRKLWYLGREVTIRRGQFVRSLSQLAEASHLTLKQTRGSIKRLIRAGFLAQERAGQSFLYTVCKYHEYQDLTRYADKEWAPVGKVSVPVLGTAGAQQGQGEGTVGAGQGQGRGNKQEGEEGKERKEGQEGEEGKKDLAPPPPQGMNDPTLQVYVQTWIEGHPEDKGKEAWVAKHLRPLIQKSMKPDIAQRHLRDRKYAQPWNAVKAAFAEALAPPEQIMTPEQAAAAEAAYRKEMAYADRHTRKRN